MLVPLVLRSIVLPYLRTPIAAAASAGASASASAASASSSASNATSMGGAARGFSSSQRRRRAAEAVLVQDALEDPFRRSWEPPAPLPQRTRRPPPPPPVRVGPGVLAGRYDERHHRLRPPRDGPDRRDRIGSSTPSSPFLTQPPPSTPRHAEPAHPARATAPSHKARTGTSKPTPQSAEQHITRPQPLSASQPKVDVPPAVAKLLGAKLFRMAVLHVLATPEYASNAALVEYMAAHLESKGAGKLARRLRQSVEMRVLGADGRIRLWSEPAPRSEDQGSSARRKPDDYWRLPRVPDPGPLPTDAQRLTHHYNKQLSRLLTKQHATPYHSPLRRHHQHVPAGDDAHAQPRLRRVRDVLHYIDRLRKHHNFVPDRITANIVVKAWLQNLSRGTDGAGPKAKARWGRAGLDARELRNVFHLVKGSIEAREPVAFVANDKNDPAIRFDGRVSYARHIVPFGRIMARAMTRVGDSDGRNELKEWVRRMEGEFGHDDIHNHKDRKV